MQCSEKVKILLRKTSPYLVLTKAFDWVAFPNQSKFKSMDQIFTYVILCLSHQQNFQKVLEAPL